MVLGNLLIRGAALLRWLLLAGLVAPSTTLAECNHLIPFGEPVHASLAHDLGLTGSPPWIPICHTGQKVAFNPERNVSDWAAFRLRQKDLLRPVASRIDNYRSDPAVPIESRVVEDDYLQTGYDRGHLAPAASMKWSEEAMKASFLMTNIAPQVGFGFNKHIWKNLERRMRQWACARGTLYVVTGPLYERKPVENGDGQDDNAVTVAVPSHFFKFAIDPVSVEAIAFVLPNTKLKTEDLPKYLTCIDEIEARSDLNFLSDLSDGVEYLVEAHVQPELWKQPEDVRCRALR